MCEARAATSVKVFSDALSTRHTSYRADKCHLEIPSLIAGEPQKLVTERFGKPRERDVPFHTQPCCLGHQELGCSCVRQDALNFNTPSLSDAD
jgi:hypothetical protein